MDIARSHQEWQTTLDAYVQERAGHERLRAVYAGDIAAFDAAKPRGLWGRLKHGFEGAVAVRPLRAQVEKIDGDIAATDAGIVADARAFHRELGEVLLKAAGGDTHTEYLRLRVLRDRMEKVRGVLLETYNLCDSAATAELIDLASNNKALSIWSHFKTGDAKQQLETAAEAVAGLADDIRLLAKSMPDTADLGFYNTIDLVVDMMGGIDFMSWINRGQLKDAMAQVDETVAQLEKIDAGMLAGQDAIIDAAVQRGRAENPAVEAYARDLAAHLGRPAAISPSPARAANR